jgi:hypothetical protein
MIEVLEWLKAEGFFFYVGCIVIGYAVGNVMVLIYMWKKGML